MNTKNLIHLGLRLGEAQRRAVDFISQFTLRDGQPRTHRRCSAAATATDRVGWLR